MKPRPLDFSAVTTSSVAQRAHKVDTAMFAKPVEPRADALPRDAASR